MSPRSVRAGSEIRTLIQPHRAHVPGDRLLEFRKDVLNSAASGPICCPDTLLDLVHDGVVAAQTLPLRFPPGAADLRGRLRLALAKRPEAMRDWMKASK